MGVTQMAKLRGLYPDKEKPEEKHDHHHTTIINAQVNLDGGKYADVPPEVLLRAKRALLEVQKFQSDDVPQVIDVLSEVK